MGVKLLISSIFIIMWKFCACYEPKSIVEFPINKQDSQKYPWAVRFISISKGCTCYPSNQYLLMCNYHEKYFYYKIILRTDDFDGSLIHKQAVLTSITWTNRIYGYNFRVFADCYYEYQGKKFITHGEKLRTLRGCQQNRAIQEWSSIEKQKNYYKNHAVALLSEPFHINERVNIISLKKDEDYVHFESCAVVFHSDICSRTDNCTIYTQYFTSMVISIENETQVQLKFDVPPGPPVLFDYQYRQYHLGEIHDERIYLGFTGSPVVCKNMNNVSQWLQVGVAGFNVQNENPNEEIKLLGSLIPFNNQDITVFKKILNPLTI